MAIDVRPLVLALLVGVPIAFSASAQTRPSFDCAKATTAHERAICGSAKLAAADEQIAATRNQAMRNVEAIARDAAGAIFERILGRPANAEAIANAVASAKNT